ncbi:hypothetical protein TTHERM_00947440 (macronuclear) [Tetrahymena thermophila SB210]|uniref:Uncharacterized protein n=1 Tax=Tetrahymena thermophila (strain SB210) TaxID=312017 RepID=I7MF72_TETTS|nr:hypothetical protein TTHERM_00947440 [Tetrahymena thermophila SB210]EAR83317.1 hypothetical protein TTHERM_00947440 [Tetrahymena thermophila SB210]|eukprot:XP_001030980.1 hypothetical protein TTHERM_00947440 [Tetrahymena thermophila SB210]
MNNNNNSSSNPSTHNISNNALLSPQSNKQINNSLYQQRAQTISGPRSQQQSMVINRTSNSQKQKSIILKIQEQLSGHKQVQPNLQSQQINQLSMKRQQSNSHQKVVENQRPIEVIAKQKNRENQVKFEQETIDLLKDDYRYVMSFVMNLIEYMRSQVIQNGLTEEINLIFPTKEQMEKTWQEQHPAEICYVLQDYVKFFVNMNQKFITLKQEQITNSDQKDEKQMILHSLELEKLQFGKKENEYQFLLEQLTKRKEELQNKLSFMEKHCTEAINYLTKDNEQLVNLVKDKDEVMDKIQEQIEIKNEHIRSQDQKLLSVLIYEFKLRKVDIRYQAQILKIMKQHSTDLEKYYSMLESCWSGLNKNGNTEVEDQFNYLKAYVQGIKNDLFNQIINIQSKYEKYSDDFNEKKKNFNQLNEVQDKIKENQLFQNEDEIQKKTQSKFSKINFAQQIQNNIILNMNVEKKKKKISRSIKDVQFMLNDQELLPSSKQQSQNNIQLPQSSFQPFGNQYSSNYYNKPYTISNNNEIKILNQGEYSDVNETLNSPPKQNQKYTNKEQQYYQSVKPQQNQMIKSALNFNSTASSSTHQLNLHGQKQMNPEQGQRRSMYSTRNNSTLVNFGSQQSIKNVSNIQPRSSLIF